MTTQQMYLANLIKRTGLFNDAQIEILLNADLSDGLPAAVARLEMAKEAEFLERLAPLLGLEYVDLAKTRPTDEALRLLPARAVHQYNALPLAVEGDALVVALGDPMDGAAADGLRLACGKPVHLRLAPAEEIDKAIKKYYGVGAEAIEKMIEDGRYEVSDTEANISKIDVNEMGQEASIVRFVNQIIAEADRQGATDIHVEPMEDELRIRYRIDGMLHKVDVPPQINRLKAAIISRLKVMANLDIAEKRLPMDGRIGIRLNGEDIDIRVSTCPTAYGESVSLRLLQKAGVTILTHATYKKTVRIARGYILQIVILETINELLHHHSGRHLGIIHVGKKHFSRVTAIYHKRGKHLTYLTKKFRTATIGRQGMNGHAIDHCVLS